MSEQAALSPVTVSPVTASPVTMLPATLPQPVAPEVIMPPSAQAAAPQSILAQYSGLPPAGPPEMAAPRPLATAPGSATRLPPVDVHVDPLVTPVGYTEAQTNFQQSPESTQSELELLRRRLEVTENRLEEIHSESKSASDRIVEFLGHQQQQPVNQLPLIRLSGFFQVQDGLTSQGPDSRNVLGDIRDGVGFRRVRLQALGAVSEFTRYSIEVDFIAVGLPSLMDVWGEEANVPFFGSVRIGHFRQPTTMDGLTSVRHLEFFERSLPYWAFDPFRRTGIMAYRVSDDRMATLAYSAFATGFTFFNNGNLNYGTLGDTRYASEIGDSGGIAFAVRATRLLYYDEPADGRYLFHIGGGYNYGGIGGEGTTGPFAKTYESRPIPEYFLGDAAGGGLTAAGTPAILDTGRIVSDDFHFFHTELAGNYDTIHFQTEFMGTILNQRGGPPIFYYGAYLQGGIFLTGESVGYNRETGVLDYNCEPFHPFWGTGKDGHMCGWGAWELAFRWSYVNLAATNIDPQNQLSNSAGPPPVPNPGSANESTVAINWWWNRYSRVQFNWIHSMPQWNSRGYGPFDIFATRFQIEF